MTNNYNGNGGKKHEIKPEFIVTSIYQQIPRRISEPQRIQLEIIAHTNFNYFDGRKIAKLLEEHHRMWRSVLMPLDFISLRDMQDGHWHADTLYIYAEAGYEFQLEELVREQFKADEIQWIGGSDAVDMLGTTEVEDKSYVILQAWWD